MQSKAMVSNKGGVFWPPPAKLRSSCKIDITYFPFDDQHCKMKFGSWTYDGFQVDVTNRSAQVDLANYVFSGEWELIDIKVIRNEVFYACCSEPYPDVTFHIIMRRRTLYYLFNIIFPCLWLTVLSLLGFWLPPDSGEKITLGITVLLAFSVFMLLIAESMPATSEFVPLIGRWRSGAVSLTEIYQHTMNQHIT
jgi:nicotinic acetylcholine receptor